ncbi:hypothetical protein [Brevibacillus migulae]|uniref:hypothetical protein n=1 Tax=Brevibacillus migulae TaxID=1644114 RepID=UPI00106EC17C|nr:hypothetical protein [Brevibacillus migulae]
MYVFVRNLFLGYVAWLTGELALKKFPSQLIFKHEISDLIAVMMFKPFHVVFSILYFLLSCGILYFLMVTHGRASFFRQGLPTWEKSMHFVFFGLSLFLLVVHIMKLTLPMIVLISIVVLFKIRTMIRAFLLQEELRKYQHRKK